MTPEQRSTLAGLADVLVPAADGLPAAAEVKLHERWIDKALEARPDLEGQLLALLDASAGRGPSEEIARLEQEDPERLAVLALLVIGAYYMHPRVRKSIGYPGQKRSPARSDEAEYDLRDGLLAPVIARGPIYRAAPAEPRR